MGFPVGVVVKNLAANAGETRDRGLILGLGKSSGEGNGNPLQYSCLEISMDRRAWQRGCKELDMTAFTLIYLASNKLYWPAKFLLPS